jgi:hypothetical protein
MLTATISPEITITSTELTPVNELSLGALFAGTTDVSWADKELSTDYDYIVAPDCQACGWGASYEDHEWVCANVDCDEHIVERDYEDGPIYNELYSLPSYCSEDYNEEAATKIKDLPLCIITPGEQWYGEYGLALTGCGMNLGWEICEAYMRLGFLPPAQLCRQLPEMCGRGHETSSGEASESDTWILAGCKRSLEEAINSLSYDLQRLDRV